jgi:hypothetical protein
MGIKVSLPHSAQTGPASYRMGTGGSYSEKRQKREADKTSASSATVKKDGATSPLPKRLNGMSKVVQDVQDPTLPRQSAHRWRLGCQPYVPVAFTPRHILWYSFMSEGQ